MSYFKNGDVVRHTAKIAAWKSTSDQYPAEGEWTVDKVTEQFRYNGKGQTVQSALVSVSNGKERFSADEQFFLLINPTPEERAQELLGGEYL